MMKEAKKLLESRLRLSGWLMPYHARESIKRQLLDHWICEIGEKEEELNDEFEKKDMVAFLSTKGCLIELTKNYWPPVPFLGREAIPVCLFSMELCGICFFLSEALWLVLVAIALSALNHSFPGNQLLGALHGLGVMTLAAFTGLLISGLSSQFLIVLLKDDRPRLRAQKNRLGR